jgi:hypothetical protein
MPSVETIAKRATRRRWILPCAALLLGAAVVAPPLVSLNRVHRRIADSISQAIGRPVTMASIKLRLLPRPGFEIADFVVEEDPAFGAEPILRSSQVVASVRLLPLWRGRLEIARIAFDEPSVNLVRNQEGRWNFNSLLSQAAQVPKAPTGERHPGRLQRFPYIEAANARINFKSGDEKLPFSFFNADLAVWLENPSEWRIQFAAQPVRTDVNLDLQNTGTLRLDGSLRQAPALSRMPMNLHAEWTNAPLGQLSKILTGSDADWRGELNAAAEIAGSVDHALLKLTASGEGVHRVEFEPREPLDVEIKCNANFSRPDLLLDDVTCLLPTGEGHLLLTGSAHAVAAKPDPNLTLELNHVPVPWALDGVRLVRAQFASSLVPTGVINGSFTYASPAKPASARDAPIAERHTPGTRNGNPESDAPRLSGQATVTRVTIASPALQKPLALPDLHLAVRSQPPSAARELKTPTTNAGRNELRSAAPSPDELLLEPFILPLPAVSSAPAARSGSLTVSAAFARHGFSVHLGGESRVRELISLGSAFGLVRTLPVNFGAQGVADLDLTARGPWMLPIADPPIASAALDGTLRLRNAQLAAGFLAQPLRIPAAQAVFAGDQVTWTATGMSYGPLRGDGTLTYPLFCASAGGCVPNFSLRLASLDAETAQSALLGAQRHGELVERLLDRLRDLNQDPPAWPPLDGTVQIAAMTIGPLSLKDVAADVAVDKQTLQLKSSTAHALDGQLRLSGTLRVADQTPRYEIEAQLDNASARALSGLFAESWGPGTVRLQTGLVFSGFAPKELLSSARGSFHWEWTKGALAPTAAQSAKAGYGAATRFDSWIADGIVLNNTLDLQKSEWARAKDATPLTGTISFARELKLSSPDPANPLQITGTLQHPVIEAAAAETTARF